MTQPTRLSHWLLATLLLLPLTACSEPKPSKVGVSVSAINYTGQELGSFVFQNPDDPQKVAGGPGLLPYGAGGTMCCYSLPKKWRPGIKVKLVYYWWKGKEEDTKDRTTRIFEVPQYPDREPGMLWALFYEDGSVEVVSSDYDPGHEKWPGKVKSWPVPSLEYRRKLWGEEMERTRDMIQNSRNLLELPGEDEESKKLSIYVIERATQQLKQLEANKP